jgi:uncharacterized paraquat-inducible protein A
MKIIAAFLIALAVVLGLVTSVGAFDPRTFWEQQGRNLP